MKYGQEEDNVSLRRDRRARLRGLKAELRPESGCGDSGNKGKCVKIASSSFHPCPFTALDTEDKISALHGSQQRVSSAYGRCL